MPATAAEAFEWDRRGAPQVRHSHALLGRLRKLLVDHHPDVLEALLDEGATEIRMANRKPATLDDQSPRDGDDDLVMLADIGILNRNFISSRDIIAKDAII